MTYPLAQGGSSDTHMRFTMVPDGAGGYRHELRPATGDAPVRGRRRGRRAPAPLVDVSSEASAQQLKQLIERAENIGAEIAELQADQADVFAEATARGFDAARMREIIALRKKDPETRQEAEAILETYMIALGLR